MCIIGATFLWDGQLSLSISWILDLESITLHPNPSPVCGHQALDTSDHQTPPHRYVRVKYHIDLIAGVWHLAGQVQNRFGMIIRSTSLSVVLTMVANVVTGKQ